MRAQFIVGLSLIIMETFYRIETEDHQGPYRNKLELTLMEWLEMEDVFSLYDDRFERYMREHPSPMSSNDRDIGDAFYHKSDMDEYVFGFHSLEQLHKWFSSDKEIAYLKHYNFSISVYEAEDIETSQYQAIANKNSLKLINKLTIS